MAGSLIDQLPESRRTVLDQLKRRGSATISQLAEALQVSGEAIRQQLIQLQRDGWVETRMERSGSTRAGRPSTHFLLSEAGEHLFPKRYDDLTLTVLDAVGERLGTEALASVLSAVVDQQVALWQGRLVGLSLIERLEALKDLYLEEDPYVEVELADDGAIRLIERNCPFLGVAMARPALCSVTVNTLSRLLGYRVVREAKFQKGDLRCVFRVLTDEPRAENAPFELEGD